MTSLRPRARRTCSRTVPYFKSSQVCSACGAVQENAGLLRKNKQKRKFVCERCEKECNSDANAARVLARVFWGEIDLPDPRVEKAARKGRIPGTPGVDTLPGPM